MRFIEFTDHEGNSIYINSDKILCLRNSSKPEHTVIEVGGSMLTVKDTPDKNKNWIEGLLKD